MSGASCRKGLWRSNKRQWTRTLCINLNFLLFLSFRGRGQLSTWCSKLRLSFDMDNAISIVYSSRFFIREAVPLPTTRYRICFWVEFILIALQTTAYYMVRSRHKHEDKNTLDIGIFIIALCDRETWTLSKVETKRERGKTPHKNKTKTLQYRIRYCRSLKWSAIEKYLEYHGQQGQNIEVFQSVNLKRRTIASIKDALTLTEVL